MRNSVRKTRIVSIVLISGLFAFAVPATFGKDPARRVSILFLGDKGPHRPAERAMQLIPVMKDRGIDITYTDHISDLNPENLQKFDGLFVYANIVTIAPEQEKAVLDYVSQGGAYIPIHCASYCFHNSPKLIALTGAQFRSHGGRIFRTKIAEPDHPIMTDLEAFESWDETYVHHKHNEKDRIVLSYREGNEQAPDRNREPWTWVRTHGEGRVFYTAWGHDHRTWGNPGFHDLVERGIRWSTRTLDREDPSFRAPSNPKQIIASRNPKPFEYKEAKIPFYPGGKAWGTNEKRKKMQLPLPAEESMKHMVTPEGFEVKLFAAEPQIGAALAMAWDERGRLWLCESVDYPNEMRVEGEGRDRIRICEDTDGDGKADKFTIFAENLSIPTSLAFANGGVIVHQAPHTLFLKDLDGDEKADTREVLFSGWGTVDTHAGPSNLQYGLDNHFWGIVGYSSFNGRVGGQHHRFGAGFYRFTPDGKRMEFIRNNNNNSWGIGFSEEGHIFGSTANRNPSVYASIPNRYFEKVNGWSSKALEPITRNHYYATPLSQNIRQVDHHGGYTAAAGHALYTARTYPKPYWNRVAFVAEPTGKLVGTFVIDRDGAGFKSSTPFNLVASDDEWTAPIMAEVGPDGNVWILDWYNYIVQHNPTPAGYKTGKGNAYETDLRDKKRSRIYRIVHKTGKSSKSLDLSNASPEDLVDALRNHNMFWRRHAQRLLIERGKKDVVSALVEVAGDTTVDEIGLNPGVIHALWTLHGLGAIDSVDSPGGRAVVNAMKHASAGVRLNAIRVLPRNDAGLDVLMSSDSLNDDDAQVRMAVLLALADMPSRGDVGAVIYQSLTAPMNEGDKLMHQAAIAAAATHDSGFITAVLAETQDDEPTGRQPEEPKNVIKNNSFEDAAAGKPASWRMIRYSGQAQFSVAPTGHTGKRSVSISSTNGADASWTFTAKVSPNSRYRLSARIRTANIKSSSGMGALMNIHQLSNPRAATKAITGTTGWTQVSVEFDTRGFSSIDVNCLFGGWGRSTGQAWYDDISLTKIGASLENVESISGEVGDVFRIVTQHYAQRAPRDSILETLESLRKASPEVVTYVLDGLADGWPEDAAPQLSQDDKIQLIALMNGLDTLQQERLLMLSRKWDREDLFSGNMDAIRDAMKRRVTDGSLQESQRIDAATRLIQLNDVKATIDLLLAMIDPQTSPDFSVGMIAAVAESRRPETAKDIIAGWNRYSPTVRRAAVNAMLQRKAWSLALLDAIGQGTLHRSELTAEQTLRLTNHPDEQIASLANGLAGMSLQNADRLKVFEQMKPALTLDGDITRGKTLFTDRCMVCHTIDAVTGGKVGPNLSGIGERAKDEILLEIIDPNRSLEGTYRMWTVETSDFELISGKLVSEDKTSVTMLDLTGKEHVIQRDNIEMMRVQNTSIMPNGLIDELEQEDIAALLSFLAASRTHQ